MVIILIVSFIIILTPKLKINNKIKETGTVEMYTKDHANSTATKVLNTGLLTAVFHCHKSNLTQDC